ncbi:MAG: hypothetical protein EOP85_16760, partial [Verrucomicrobiaceae bacterium]
MVDLTRCSGIPPPPMNILRSSAIIVLSAGFSLAAPGDLDKGLNATGRLAVAFGQFSEANALAVAPDGGILAAGQTITPRGHDTAVVKITPRGLLDTSFSGDGGVVTNAGTGLDGDPVDDSGHAMVVQPDGKILVAGQNGYYFTIIRYNKDGSLDTFFGDLGIQRMYGFAGTRATGIVVQPDGSIVVTGWLISGGSGFIARFTSSGHPDPGFVGGSYVSFLDLPAGSRGSAIALQSDGRILVAGRAGFLNEEDFLVIRFKKDGTRDPSFGPDGIRT